MTLEKALERLVVAQTKEKHCADLLTQLLGVVPVGDLPQPELVYVRHVWDTATAMRCPRGVRIVCGSASLE